MAILHSCCFWKSVRKGSYASAIYALVYFGSSCIIISIYLYEEHKYLSGEVNKPIGESFLEKDEVSPTTVIFNIMLLICASCGFVSSIIVFIALKKDQKELLIPWILFMIVDLIIEILHFIYIVIIKTLDFEPLTATLFTIDFFIICLNVYCLLCVISQYQEYKAGRGYAVVNDDNQHVSQRHNPPSPTVGTYLNTFRRNNHDDLKQFSTYPHSKFTKFGTRTSDNSPLTKQRYKNTASSSLRSTSSSNCSKKHVQFTDYERSCTNAQTFNMTPTLSTTPATSVVVSTSATTITTTITATNTSPTAISSSQIEAEKVLIDIVQGIENKETALL